MVDRAPREDGAGYMVAAYKWMLPADFQNAVEGVSRRRRRQRI